MGGGGGGGGGLNVAGYLDSSHKVSQYLLIHSVFAFYTEIQDVRQKWQQNDFWQKVSDDCVHPASPNFSEVLRIFHFQR